MLHSKYGNKLKSSKSIDDGDSIIRLSTGYPIRGENRNAETIKAGANEKTLLRRHFELMLITMLHT